ncbi:hypothetical protein GCM10009616_28800 [Microlunatus lacustris]
MASALPLRVFLASPGDLSDEREVVRACIEEHNARRRGESNVVYELVGWERVRGTARRPQEAINELIRECHFLVAIFKGSWGSEPGSPWGYTSGTEEELFTALLGLGLREHPMRDVWVAFLDHPSPDDRITNLRRQMTTHHSIMYESIADTRALKDKLSERLRAWEVLAEHKVHRHVELLPSTGKEVLRAANLRLHGEKLVELGQPEAGRSELKEAAVLGGPTEQLAYARSLSRLGELDDAYSWTQEAIEHFTTGPSHLYSSVAAEAFAAQAGVLRLQGRHRDSIGRLEQALTLLDEHDPHSQRIRCRILDELGLAHRKVNDSTAARTHFVLSLETRRKMEDDSGIAQSLVNLARLEVGLHDLEAGALLADEAVKVLQSLPPTPLTANAEILIAQVRLRQGRPDDAVPHAERALALNQQMASRQGEAISLLILAQCARAANRNADAEQYASACLEVNTAMGNVNGAQRAQWILDQLA